MKTYLKLSVVLIAVGFFSCQGNKKEASDETVSARDKDTVAVIDLNQIDTASLESLSVDSLKMCAAFQTAANEFTTGYKNKDAKIYVKYSHPAIVKMNGGMDKFIAKVGPFMKLDTFKFAKMITGPVKRVEPAVDPKGKVAGWYCLMPVRRWITNNPKDFRVQWLAGQTLNMGKDIYFIDITGIPKEKIYQLIPDFHFVLDKELAKK